MKEYNVQTNNAIHNGVKCDYIIIIDGLICFKVRKSWNKKDESIFIIPKDSLVSIYKV